MDNLETLRQWLVAISFLLFLVTFIGYLWVRDIRDNVRRHERQIDIHEGMWRHCKHMLEVLLPKPTTRHPQPTTDYRLFDNMNGFLTDPKAPIVNARILCELVVVNQQFEFVKWLKVDRMPDDVNAVGVTSKTPSPKPAAPPPGRIIKEGSQPPAPPESKLRNL